MNFFEGMDPSLSNSFSNSFLDDQKNIFPFSLDESEVPVIKDDKSTISKNLFITKKTIKEKINHQKLLLEQKRGLTEKEKREIYFDKKEDLKRRNRVSAQKSREAEIKRQQEEQRKRELERQQQILEEQRRRAEEEKRQKELEEQRKR